MAWTTLAAAKNSLGIASGDTTQDSQLAQWISENHHLLLKEVQQEIGNVVEAISVANPTALTVRGHGYNTGDMVSISGSNSTPVVDGQQTVTVVDQDTFTVPVNVTIAGTKGWINPVFQNQYYSTDGSKVIALRQRPVLVNPVPVLYYDPNGYFGTPPAPATPFDSTTQMAWGIDFNLYIDNEREQSSERGWLMRINGYWPKPNERVRGILISVPGPSQGNLKVTYTAGRKFLPLDLQRASNLLLAITRMTAVRGMLMSAESLDYYNYTLADNEAAQKTIGTIQQILANYKEWRLGGVR